MGKRKRAVKPAESASDRAERALVTAAIGKVQRGQVPSSQERAALRRFEKQQEEDKRWQFYRSIPKAHWKEMSGRTPRTFIDQAKLHGFPYPTGPKTPIDLPAVVKWLHDFLADNAQRLSAPHTDDPLLAGSNSPALERYRLARAAREELELAARRGELLDVDELLTWYDAEVAAPIRRSLEALQSQFGPAAMQLVAKSLDQAGAAVTKRLKGEGVRG